MSRPNLARLRRLARLFQHECHEGEPSAVARLAAVLPVEAPATLALTKAQTVLAREHGFASWPSLKAHVEALPPAPTPEESADAVDAEALAERWFGLAEAENLRGLGRALAVGKRRKEAARELMRGQPARYAGFVAALVRGLDSRRQRDRFECAAALDTFGDGACREPLARLMDDPVPKVRWMAMHALSCHACGGAGVSLEPAIRARIVRGALGDPNVHVRRHAAMALVLAGDRDCADLFRDMLARETDGKLLRGVAWALSEVTRRNTVAEATSSAL